MSSESVQHSCTRLTTLSQQPTTLAMLDKLPVELLDQVLDEIHSPSTSQGARERTGALLSLCLVSKRILGRARRPLWRDVKVEYETKFFALVDALSRPTSGPLRMQVKSLVVFGTCSGNGREHNELVRKAMLALLFLPELREVRLELSHGSDFTMPTMLRSKRSHRAITRSTLIAFLNTNLTVLSLSGISLSSVPVTTPFPALHTLALVEASLHCKTARALLRPETFPALRAFVFTVDGTHNGRKRKITDYLSPSFLQQLEVVQLNIRDLDLFTPSLFQDNAKLFFTEPRADGLNYGSFPIHHLRCIEV
jgi:hypothetical protein